MTHMDCCSYKLGSGKATAVTASCHACHMVIPKSPAQYLPGKLLIKWAAAAISLTCNDVVVSSQAQQQSKDLASDNSTAGSPLTYNQVRFRSRNFHHARLCRLQGS